MSFLETIDRWVIERVFEPAAHWLENLAGVDNFMLARSGVVAWAAAACSAVLLPNDALAARAYVAVFAAATLSVSVGLFWYIRTVERSCERGFSNPGKASSAQRWIRSILSASMLISLLAPGSGISAITIGFAAYWAYSYFVACDRSPPQEVQQHRHRAIA